MNDTTLNIYLKEAKKHLRCFGKLKNPLLDLDNLQEEISENPDAMPSPLLGGMK